jgi:hypothetical protein
LKIIKHVNNANKYKQLNLSGLKNDTIIEVRGCVSNKEPFSVLLTDQGTFINENNLKDKMKDIFPSNLKNEKYFEDEFFDTYFLLEKPLFKIRKIKRDEFEILESFDTKLLEEYNSDFITNTKINL